METAARGPWPCAGILHAGMRQDLGRLVSRANTQGRTKRSSGGDHAASGGELAPAGACGACRGKRRGLLHVRRERPGVSRRLDAGDPSHAVPRGVRKRRLRCVRRLLQFAGCRRSRRFLGLRRPGVPRPARRPTARCRRTAHGGAGAFPSGAGTARVRAAAGCRGSAGFRARRDGAAATGCRTQSGRSAHRAFRPIRRSRQATAQAAGAADQCDPRLPSLPIAEPADIGRQGRFDRPGRAILLSPSASGPFSVPRRSHPRRRRLVSGQPGSRVSGFSRSESEIVPLGQDVPAAA